MSSVNFKTFFKILQSYPLLLSFLLHGIFFLFLTINFTQNKNKDFLNQVKVVELILPITNKTNLPPSKSVKKSESKKEELIKSEPKKTESIKQEPAKNEQTKIEPNKQNPIKKEKTTTAPAQKENLKKEKTKENILDKKAKKNTYKEQVNDKKNDSIDDLLTSLEGKEIENTTLESELESLNSSNIYDDTQMLSISEIDAIKGQIQKCWTEPAGGLKKNGLSVLLKIKLLIDGNIEDIKVKEAPKTDNTIMNQLAIDTAIRAIKMCAPYKMPMNNYNSWKELEIMFDPKEM